MRVFISFSGETSKAVALALREWLPSVIQALDPWMSNEDLKKGARWSVELADRLEKTDFGICCLTPDNLEAPWLHFEAGALAKRVTAAYVCPYLFHVDLADVQGPLREFQLTKADLEDTRKLMKTINGALTENRLSDKRLDEAFGMCWPKLQKQLSDIPPDQVKQKAPRDQRDMIEEILTLVRGLARAPNPMVDIILGIENRALGQRSDPARVLAYSLEDDG